MKSYKLYSINNIWKKKFLIFMGILVSNNETTKISKSYLITSNIPGSSTRSKSKLENFKSSLEIVELKC